MQFLLFCASQLSGLSLLASFLWWIFCSSVLPFSIWNWTWLLVVFQKIFCLEVYQNAGSERKKSDEHSMMLYAIRKQQEEVFKCILNIFRPQTQSYHFYRVFKLEVQIFQLLNLFWMEIVVAKSFPWWWNTFWDSSTANWVEWNGAGK